MKKLFFTPGPAQLFTTVPGHIRHALEEDIPSISHRSQRFKDIYRETVTSLKKLLRIPDAHHIFFVASGTEAMERTLQNCVEKYSFHFVNGAFSQRFYETARELGKQPMQFVILSDSEESQVAGFFAKAQDDTIIPKKTELICITQNETSTGMMIPLQVVYQLREQYPEKLIALDIVSLAPYADVDYASIDITFFSVQKAFGLPAGLGVMIVNPRAIEKAKAVSAKMSIGSYHNFLNLLHWGGKYQTLETPNVLGLYLLGKVTQDFLTISIEKIRKETEEKARVLYDFFEHNDHYSLFVKEKTFRSQTVIVTEVQGGSEKILEKLEKAGMIVGDGYGIHKGKQLRIANFPVHTIEDIKRLIGVLK